MRHRARLLALVAFFLFLVATSNDRLALWVLTWTSISLLVVTYALARTGASGLEVVRRALPERLVAGQPLTLACTLRNLGSLPRSGLLLTDRWNNEVQGTQAEQRVLAPFLAGESAVEIEAETVPAQRGRLVLGPIDLLVGDPFGLFELQRPAAGTRAEVIVHPRVESLSTRLAGGRLGLESVSTRSAPSGLVLHNLREYQPGDDLRHVHWLASARRGTLLTKEYERSAAASAVTFLDLDQRQVFGQGGHSSLELAITAAASVLAWQSEQGHETRLLAYEEGVLDLALKPGGLTRAVLDELALVRGSGTVSMAALIAQQAQHLQGQGAAVVITAGVDEELLRGLLTRAELGRAVQLLLVDAYAWAASEPEGIAGWVLPAEQVRARAVASGLGVSILRPDRPLSAALGGEQP